MVDSMRTKEAYASQMSSSVQQKRPSQKRRPGIFLCKWRALYQTLCMQREAKL